MPLRNGHDDCRDPSRRCGYVGVMPGTQPDLEDGRSIIIERSGSVRENGRLPPPARRLPPVAVWGILLVATILAIFAAVVMPESAPMPGGLPVKPSPGALRLVVPPGAGPPPAIQPVNLLDVPPPTARAINAAVPLVDGPNPPARPFVIVADPMDAERALTCLAAAEWYEAGDDAVGEQAVAQVVLNRVRHPAFPKTVCGVVFQGAERTTGCQFTFACDHSLARKPSSAAWERARAIAKAALTGHVARGVGLATHYHTDWVVPYWSASLDKIAQVETHLFFRWRGWWGQPQAFAGFRRGVEPIDPRIAFLVSPASSAAALPDAPPGALGGTADAVAATPVRDAEPPRAALDAPGVDLKGSRIRLADAAAASYVLSLDGSRDPGSYAIAALNLCAGRPDCTVVGYLHDERVPGALPVSGAELGAASFYYRSRKSIGLESVLWNCHEILRRSAAQCIPGTEAAAR